ncbi:MAG: tripartite tricarboxylate transporter substrate binding protein [Acetobacteraceae bacterium]|nr:tripartite tricarboxylate transporter substrate binding protein [Acetobacteraceae bacterium]MDW8397470.1 tripartite tricarboxylate transporter substrate binding protein [Acetobacteraceae bacterium]
MRRRHLLPLLAAPFVAPRRAAAQRGWAPARQISLVVPFPPGGPTDIVARLSAPLVQASLGQPAVVENRPGATGVVGTRHVLAQPADGHTVMFAASGTLTIMPLVTRDVGFDPVADFAPVTLAMAAPNMLVVHPSVPATTLAELAAWIRAQPGGANYGSSGIGSAEQLGMELLHLRLGVELTHVPFQGGAPTVQALIAGTVPMSMMNAGTALPHVQAGRLRAIAVAGPRRFAPLPEVPTMAEQGQPEVLSQSWTGILVRAGTPAPAVVRLHQAFTEALRTQDVTQRLAALGFTVEASEPQVLARLIAADLDRWRAVVRDARIQIT